MKLQALKDTVIIKVHYKEKTTGGLFIPEGAAQAYNSDFYGEVISVGPKYKYDIKPGDKVIFRRHEGKPLTIDRVKYLILKSKWVEGILED